MPVARPITPAPMMRTSQLIGDLYAVAGMGEVYGGRVTGYFLERRELRRTDEHLCGSFVSTK